MSLIEVALIWIALSTTGVLIALTLGLIRLRRMADRLEPTVGRLDRMTDRLEPILDGIGTGAQDVVQDLRTITGELSTAVRLIGLTRRTRASVAGARAALGSFFGHSNGHEASEQHERSRK
jgi:hypothetical protein